MSKLKWVDLEKIEGEDKGGRTSWIMVSEKTVGAQNLAVGMNETHVGGKVPQHMHNTEEEVMFFISGKGQFVTGDEIIELRPGICVYNPPGGFHEIINTGDEILKFIWIYAPQLKNHRLEKQERENND